jgi:hypothetical protein
MNAAIERYNDAQTPVERGICSLLASEIDQGLPDAESKIWHAHAVWFLDGNPIVGYSRLKDGVRLLFWSGQSFDEEALRPQGTFEAAEVRFTSADQIDRAHAPASSCSANSSRASARSNLVCARGDWLSGTSRAPR